MTVTVVTVDNQPIQLGRQQVHDERSRAFPARATVDKSTWHDKKIRLYEPRPNPNQEIGCCTGVAKCSQFNAIGNRKMGQVLDMPDAEALYSKATTLDPWMGSWPPDDTGSSGLASAKAAKATGLGGEYRWIFGGADEVIQNVVEGRVVSVGTWWYSDMFYPLFYTGPAPDGIGRIQVSGAKAGGHQYIIRGYNVEHDLVLGRCWWGEFKDFWMSRADLQTLLMDGGDAHYQEVVQ